MADNSDVEGSDTVMMSCELKELGPTSVIMQLLECPICKGVPMPPIWNCDNGHVACDQCKRQMGDCGLCRAPFSGGRNFFMEAVVSECSVSCPYTEAGCRAVFQAHFMKNHASECKFGPKIKWIACQDGVIPPNAVQGGTQHGVKLFVIRAPYMESHSPGKIFEYAPPGVAFRGTNASLAWGGGERFMTMYEVLVSPVEQVSWIPSQNGVKVPNAVIGGTSETGETLYIGRYIHEGNLINGKIHPSHRCCYIGVNNREIASMTYEILVEVGTPSEAESGPSTTDLNVNRNNQGAGYDMFS